MRLFVVGIAIVVTLVGSACSTAASSAPTPKAMRVCLKSGGAKLDTSPTLNLFDYPEIKNEIDWVIGGTKNGVLSYDVEIMFTRDSGDAKKLIKRLNTLGASMGFTKSELRDTTGRRANVVWITDVGHPPSVKQFALLNRCLAA